MLAALHECELALGPVDGRCEQRAQEIRGLAARLLEDIGQGAQATHVGAVGDYKAVVYKNGERWLLKTDLDCTCPPCTHRRLQANAALHWEWVTIRPHYPDNSVAGTCTRPKHAPRRNALRRGKAIPCITSAHPSVSALYPPG